MAASRKEAVSAPKPYDFVPFAKVVQRDMPFGVETLWAGEGYYSGEFEFRLHTLSPAFVAAGRYSLSEEVGLAGGQAVRAFYRLNRVPTIPASTLKGVVRGVAEAVSPSHVTITRLDLPGGLDKTDRCAAGKKACPACALFGGGGRQAHIGLVRFEDAPLASPTATMLYRLSPLYAPRATPRSSPGIYLDNGQFKGRKFYYHGQPIEDPNGDLCEVLPANARLAGKLSFRNLDAPLLGLLFFALGLDGSFRLNLGSGKPLCLGTVEIVPIRLTLLSRQSYLNGDVHGEAQQGEPMAQFIIDQMKAAQEARVILGPQAKKLREILKWPNSRPAPGGAY